MKKSKKYFGAFTLIETVVVLMLASLILVAVLGVYSRMRANAAIILGGLEKHRQQEEILQKIAEDIDRLAAPGFEARVTFKNKINNGYRSALLVLENGYYGNNNIKDLYERIEWRSSYDPQYDALTLYRMHSGLNVEDPALGVNKEEPPFIPVAEGITYFELKAQQGENILSDWTSNSLPKAVQIGISFALPQKLESGVIGVPEEEISYRTVAIDRTRLIQYQFVKKQFDSPDEEDPNQVSNETDPNGLMKTERDAE